jgi:hypothetical protein
MKWATALSPAIAGSLSKIQPATWGLRPRLYAAVRFADLTFGLSRTGHSRFSDWTFGLSRTGRSGFADWTFGVRGLDARGSRTGRSGFADWTLEGSRDWTLEVRGLKDCKNCELTLIYAHTVNLSPIIFICNP